MLSQLQLRICLHWKGTVEVEQLTQQSMPFGQIAPDSCFVLAVSVASVGQQSLSAGLQGDMQQSLTGASAAVEARWTAAVLQTACGTNRQIHGCEAYFPLYAREIDLIFQK
jgi:hypothetical protein